MGYIYSYLNDPIIYMFQGTVFEDIMGSFIICISIELVY